MIFRNKPTCVLLLTLPCVVLSSPALGGARFDLVPTPPVPPGGYAPNTVVRVDVTLVDTGGTEDPMYIRFIQMDLADTSEGLAVITTSSGNCCCETFLEWFEECFVLCQTCYFVDYVRAAGLEQYLWTLSEPGFNELRLPSGGALPLGYFRVDVGVQSGMLDIMNVSNTDPGFGAYVAFGFENEADPTPQTIWWSHTGELTGGRLALPVNHGHIVSSVPVDQAIDARQPTDLDGTIVYGWQQVDLTFSAAVSGLVTTDFEITVEGGQSPAPTVIGADVIATNTLRVALDRPIEPGAWTTISHLATETSVRLGFLPGDVNGDGTSSPIDILVLIDALNGNTELPTHSTDVNRSGVTGPSDILTVIDLLNGAGEFDEWNGVSLP